MTVRLGKDLRAFSKRSSKSGVCPHLVLTGALAQIYGAFIDRTLLRLRGLRSGHECLPRRRGAMKSPAVLIPILQVRAHVLVIERKPLLCLIAHLQKRLNHISETCV